MHIMYMHMAMAVMRDAFNIVSCFYLSRPGIVKRTVSKKPPPFHPYSAGSNHQHFLVFAKHPPHGIADLAQRGLALHRFHNRRHQVLSAARPLLHPACRRQCPLAVAPRPEGPQPLHLLPFQLGIDPLQRNRRIPLCFFRFYRKAFTPTSTCSRLSTDFWNS